MNRPNREDRAGSWNRRQQRKQREAVPPRLCCLCSFCSICCLLFRASYAPRGDRSLTDSGNSFNLGGVTARDRSECSPDAIEAWPAGRRIHIRRRLSAPQISAVDIVAEKAD